MSPVSAPSFSSAAIWSSARFRSRSTPCAASWSFQKLGSEMRASSAFRRWRFCAASKIAPHERHALPQTFIAMLQILKNHARPGRASQASDSRLPRFGNRNRKLIVQKISFPESRGNQNNGNDDAEPSEPVTVSRVDGEIRAEVIGQIGGGSDVRRQGVEGSSVRVNRNGEAVIRDAQQPAPILDRSNACHMQMLHGSGGAAEPSVIRDVDQQFCAV